VRGRALRRLLVGVAIAGTAILTLLALRGLDWREAWEALRASDPLWLVPSVALLGVAVLLKAVRWRFLFLPERRPPLRDALEASLLGYLYLAVLPARAGEVPRILVLNRRTGIPNLQIAATVLVERVFDLTALLTLFFVFVPWWPDNGWARPLALVAGVFGAGLIVTVALLRLTGERGLRLLLRPVGFLPRVGRERAEGAARTLRNGLAGLHDGPTALLALLFTLLAWAALAASCDIAFRALHLDLPPLAGMLVVIAISVAASLPSLPAGIGIFEAATLKALEAYDVPREDGLAFGVAWHLVNVVPFLLAGPLVALTLRARARRAL